MTMYAANAGKSGGEYLHRPRFRSCWLALLQRTEFGSLRAVNGDATIRPAVLADCF